jgi:hypothetical protein
LRWRSAWGWLLAKEWRELVAARSWWILLAAMGPLVGFSFIGAARTYAEASGLNGTSTGVGEAFSPLIGIWAPTFSACELAAVFLLPFVVIRLVAGSRQSGALKLELQHPMPVFAQMVAKALVLAAGWAVASAAPLVAVGLWKAYGGTLYGPELASVVAGHLLNAGLTIGLAAAMAAAAEHPSTAAILTLGATVGTWIVSFVAAVNGGWWERAAAFTPTAMVAEFQHGLVRLDLLVVALVLTSGGLVVAAIWLRTGVPATRRGWESAAVGAVMAAALGGASFVHASWDLSEDRASSFSRTNEAALRQIRTPVRIEAHLAPEDPRRFELERRVLKKLRRVVPDLDVEYRSASTIGLFEQSDPHYGEIWYVIDGRRSMSRATTEEDVLEVLFDLARVTPRAVPEPPEFRGHPLAVPPRGAGWVFYGAWPLAVAAAALSIHRRRS